MIRRERGKRWVKEARRGWTLQLARRRRGTVSSGNAHSQSINTREISQRLGQHLARRSRRVLSWGERGRRVISLNSTRRRSGAASSPSDPAARERYRSAGDATASWSILVARQGGAWCIFFRVLRGPCTWPPDKELGILAKTLCALRQNARTGANYHRRLLAGTRLPSRSAVRSESIVRSTTKRRSMSMLGCGPGPRGRLAWYAAADVLQWSCR